MEKALIEVGSLKASTFWVSKKAKEEISNISQDISTFSSTVEEKAKWVFNKLKDKELDIIEMAVYGDVIRPGNQCRCRTVAGVLGTYKSKDRLAACKLPYGEGSLHPLNLKFL